MSSIKVDNIVILAGGESRRFWPLKDKLLFKFLGKELVLHQIEMFKPFSKRLFLVINKRLEEKLRFLKDQKIGLVVQPRKDKGQAGALRCVIGNLKGEILVVNANDVFQKEDIVSFLRKVKREDIDGQLAFVKVKNYFPGGYLKFEGDRVVEVVEKPGEGNVPSDCVRAVLDYFSDTKVLKQALERVKNFHFDEQYERAISLILKERCFKAYHLTSGFLTLKYPWHILSLTQHFLERVKKSRMEGIKIGKGTIIEGPVLIGKGVKIGSFCKLKGPLYIDKDSVVGDYSLIRESHIGESCIIGAHSEVARSYLSYGVLLHRNYVGDSVFGKNIMLGAGVITANFRLDGREITSKVKEEKISTGLLKLGAVLGDRVKIGSGTVLLPGVKIGEGSFIGPGELVKEDIEEGKFVFQGKIVKNRMFER